MAQAFTVFANRRRFHESRTYTQVLDSNGNVVLDNPVVQRQAIRANAANNVTDMMVGSVTSGTSSAARFYGMEIAGKTGSSGDNDDRWFVGMTPYYVGVVWTGYDIPAGASTGPTPPASSGAASCSRSTRGWSTAASPTRPAIGGDTQIFGDLTSPTPSPTPDAGRRTPSADESDARRSTPWSPMTSETIEPTEPVGAAA